MTKLNRVVVTGMGILAPNGIGLEAFWDSLVAGRSGVGPITHFDASAFKSRIAGEVKGFEPLDYIDPKYKPKRMARHTQFAFAAMKMALADADFEPSRQPVDYPIPVMLGVSTTRWTFWRIVGETCRDAVPVGLPPALSIASRKLLPRCSRSRWAYRPGRATIASACPSGLDAIASAAIMIRQGEADVAVAEAPMQPSHRYRWPVSPPPD
jgi:3-oxoacyl-(acyl-carrier-protein) synthase